MVQLTTEARKAYKEMVAALEEEAEGSQTETELSIITTEFEKSCLSETGKASPSDHDEDIPNYSEYLLTYFWFKFSVCFTVFTETNGTWHVNG